MKDIKEAAYLEYCFLFDASSVWTNIYDFESDLANFFDSHGLEAVLLNGVKGGPMYKRILLITKRPTIPAPPPPVDKGTPAQVLKEIAGPSQNVKPKGRMVTAIIKPREKMSVPQMRFKRGKFLSRKGYLQRKG